MLIDYTAYLGYVETFKKSCNELADAVLDRKDKLDTEDDPFEYTGAVFQSEQYSDAVGYWKKLKAEYDKQGRKVSILLIIGIVITGLLIVILPTKLWFISILPLLITTIISIIDTSKSKSVPDPDDLKANLLTTVLIGFGNVVNVHYNYIPKKQVYNSMAKHGRHTDRPEDSMFGKNSNVYVRHLLSELGITLSSGESHDFSTTMEVEYDDNKFAQFTRLICTHREQVENKDGKTQTKTVTDMNGFVVSLKSSFRGVLDDTEKFIISPQVNFLSILAEDTRRALFGSSKEYVFNIEELNKKLDCHLKTTERDPEVIQHKLQSIMSPDFEDFLQFLVKRFDRYWIVATNEHVQFIVNTQNREDGEGIAGLLDKYKKGGLANALRGQNTKVRDRFDTVSTLKKDKEEEDLQYWSLFPLVDTLYFMEYTGKYIEFAMDPQKVDTEYLVTLDSYRTAIEEIATQEFDEYKQAVIGEYGTV